MKSKAVKIIDSLLMSFLGLIAVIAGFAFIGFTLYAIDNLMSLAGLPDWGHTAGWAFIAIWLIGAKAHYDMRDDR